MKLIFVEYGMFYYDLGFKMWRMVKCWINLGSREFGLVFFFV